MTPQPVVQVENPDGYSDDRYAWHTGDHARTHESDDGMLVGGLLDSHVPFEVCIAPINTTCQNEQKAHLYRVWQRR